MHSQCPEGISGVELRYEDCARNDEEEGNDCEDAMAFDYLVILIFPSKSVAHAYKQPCSLASGLLSMNVDAKMRSKVRHEREFTIISHRIEIQSHQVRQKERIATRIPGSISDIHGVRAVCAAARRRQAVLRRDLYSPPAVG